MFSKTPIQSAKSYKLGEYHGGDIRLLKKSMSRKLSSGYKICIYSKIIHRSTKSETYRMSASPMAQKKFSENEDSPVILPVNKSCFSPPLTPANYIPRYESPLRHIQNDDDLQIIQQDNSPIKIKPRPNSSPLKISIDPDKYPDQLEPPSEPIRTSENDKKISSIEIEDTENVKKDKKDKKENCQCCILI